MSARAVLGVWALLAFLMSLNGMFRELVLASAFRRGVAELVSALMGIGVIVGTTWALFRAYPQWRSADPLRLALVWTALTLAFEFLFGHYVDGKSWDELLGNYALWKGRPWPVVLLSLVVAPFLWTKSRR